MYDMCRYGVVAFIGVAQQIHQGADTLAALMYSTISRIIGLVQLSFSPDLFPHALLPDSCCRMA